MERRLLCGYGEQLQGQTSSWRLKRGTESSVLVAAPHLIGNKDPRNVFCLTGGLMERDGDDGLW